MNPTELLRIVDSLHRDKNIDTEIVFQAIEAALVSAARKQYGDESEIAVLINREDGSVTARCDEQSLDPEEMIGRIGAQTAKQVIIQKIREAERDALIDEYAEQVGHMVSGVVQRNEGGATTVSLPSVEALLPRSEQIPGESHHPNERVRAIVYEVKPQGNRVKVILSRTHPQLVRRLFEQEIPEIADEVITINAMSREPGYRSKVAVSSSDQRIDCVGACVGVRGNRIKNIVDELGGERIDIVRWNDDPEILIPNALQPADVEQVLLCDMIGRAIVLVKEDQLSLAIGRRGQNVRLASKLCGWDIEIMTAEELDEQIERAVLGFSELEGMTDEIAQALVEQGYLSYDDLSVIEPDAFQEMGDLDDEQVAAIIEQAETKAEEAELAAAEERRRHREQEMRARAEAEAAAAEQKQAEESPAPAEEAADSTAAPDAAPADAVLSGAVEGEDAVKDEGEVEDKAAEEEPPVNASVEESDAPQETEETLTLEAAEEEPPVNASVEESDAPQETEETLTLEAAEESAGLEQPAQPAAEDGEPATEEDQETKAPDDGATAS